MRLMSSICAAAIVAVAAVAAPEASAQRNRNNQATTVVVVDYQRVLAESAMGRDMAAKLQQVRTQVGAEAQQTLGAEGQSIESERQRLVQATRNMSPEQIRNSSTYGPQFEALAQRLEAFQRRGQSLQGDFECTQLIALRDFDRAISPIVRSVMESRGAGVVLDARNVQLTLPAFDVTNVVIQQLDQGEATRTANVTRRPVSECAAQTAAPAPAGQ